MGEFTGKRVQVLALDGTPLQLLSTLPCGAPARAGPFLVDAARGRVVAPAAAPAREALHVFRLCATAACPPPG